MRGQDVRKITRGFGMFGLLFGQEPRERDDVDIDLLVAYRRRHGAVGVSHFDLKQRVLWWRCTVS